MTTCDRGPVPSGVGPEDEVLVPVGGNGRNASFMSRSEQPLSTKAITAAAAVARIMIANRREPLAVLSVV
ncbi:MAG: hypothetical protein ACLP9Y_22415 [Mycobacterium sp.]